MTHDEIRAIQDEVRGWKIGEVIHSPDLSEQLSRYHKQLFGKPICSTCTGKLQGAFIKILNAKNHQLIMATSKYRIKKVNGREQMITNNHVVAGVPIHVTNANLTDEIAEKLLNSNFARFIETVEEPVKKVAPEPVKEETPEPEVIPERKSVPQSELRNMSETVISNPKLKEKQSAPAPKKQKGKGKHK